MTNESILEKLLRKRIFDYLHTGSMKLTLTDKEINSAMDAAREDEAIAFAEWASRSGWYMSNATAMGLSVFYWVKEKDERILSTPELYQQYLKHKNEKSI